MKPLYFIVASAIMAASLQSFAEDKPAKTEEKAAKPSAPMMEKPGTQMMGMRKEMWTNMQARNAELNKLVETMNSAQGTEKVDAIAAVVNKLVEIHIKMNTRMMRMHERRMKAGSHVKGMMGGKMLKEEKESRGITEQEKGTTQEKEHQQE